MTAAVTFRIDEGAIKALLHNTNGPVAIDNFRRATNVQVAARNRAHVRSGRLRRSIVKRGPTATSRGVTTYVGSSLSYALMHHEGTGPHEIRPVHAKALRFVVGGTVVFVTQVNHPGTKPNHYLTDSLPEALR